MSQFIHDAYDAAFKHWKSVRTRLEHTIQDYVDACLALETTLAVPPTMISSHLQARAFKNLELDLLFIPDYEQILSKSRYTLNQLRNSSRTLAPINSLPSEILHIILSLANRNWVTEDYINITSKSKASTPVLSCVCRRWRRLMLNSAAFWSPLEIALSGSLSDPRYKLAEIWAERSGNTLLEISISEGVEIHEPRTYDIDRATKFLTPLMSRVRGLKIHTETYAAHGIVNEIVACWVKKGAVGTASTLDINLEEGLEALALPGVDIDIDHTTFAAFFCSLKSLRLHNASINLNEIAFAGLVELHLQVVPGWYPTSSEIAAVLVASPRLRSITLIEVRVAPISYPIPDPVPLNDLEVLTLEAAFPGNLWNVLLLITSTSNAVRLSVSMGDDPQYVPAVHLFSKRCKVTMLHLQAEDPGELDISAILVQMPYLRELVLRYFLLTGNTLRDFALQRSSNLQPPTLWPALRKMFLIYCNPTEDVLSELGTLLQSSQTLLLYDHQRPELNIQYDARDELEEEMLERGVELIWMDESGDSDPTVHWTFVHN